MADTKKASAKTRRMGAWVIIGLLCLSMVGMGGAGLLTQSYTVGTVGSQEISAEAYQQALNSEIANAQQQIGRPLTVQEVMQLQINTIALRNVIRTHAIDEQAALWGVSMGDKWVGQQIADIPAFQDLFGNFNVDNYRNLLARNGTSENAFMDGLRKDGARNLVNQAIITGIEVPDTYRKTLLGFMLETRDFTWARMDGSFIKIALPEATEEDLVNFHQENPAAFTEAAYKEIAYVWVTPDDVMDKISLEDGAVEALYEERNSEYSQPEKRIIERVVFETNAEAEAALNAITSGEITFAATIEQSGQDAEIVNIGEVTIDDLGIEAEAVFAAADIGVIGPVETDLGQSLININAILDAQEQSFADVEGDLQDELMLEQALLYLDGQVDSIDDLVASGATLAEIADETIMRLGKVNWTGAAAGGISDDVNFQQAANAVNISSFPTLSDLTTGGFFALQMNGDQAAQLKPLDDVRDQVLAAWEAQQKIDTLKGYADRISSEINADTAFEKFALTSNTVTGRARSEFVDGTPPALLAEAFTIAAGETAVVEDVDSVIILRLDGVTPADLEGAQALALTDLIQNNLSQQFSSDIFSAFAKAVEAEVDVEINDNIVTAIDNSLGRAGHYQ